MRIGIDASRIAISQKTGTENYSYNIILALLNEDCQNNYILYLQKEADLPVNSHDRISKRLINLPKLWTQLGLATEVTIHPPDLLFIPAHTLPVIHRPGLKSVVTIHDLGYEYLQQYHKFPQRLYLNKSTVFAVRFATHIIAVSEATKTDLVSKLNADPEKITVVYEGCNKSLFKPQDSKRVEEVKKEFGLKKYFLFVGTVQPRKNLINLIKAYALVSTKLDIELVIVGKSGWLNTEIYALSQRLGVGSRVKFLNYVEDNKLPSLYTGAVALTFPSLFEGFGLPILEAFACGTPVLTSNTSSMPEIADDAAILVNANDIDSISREMHHIATKDVLRHQLINKGFERVKQFSWEKAAEETIEVFNRAYEK